MIDTCPHCGTKTEFTRFDDGLVDGVQYWDDETACTNEDCDWSTWDSWSQEVGEEDG